MSLVGDFCLRHEDLMQGHSAKYPFMPYLLSLSVTLHKNSEIGIFAEILLKNVIPSK